MHTSASDYVKVINKELPPLEWSVEEWSGHYPVTANYSWTNKTFYIEIHIESPAQHETCWIVEMVFGWFQCDMSVNVSVRGRDLKKTYARARERFDRRIQIYMQRFAKEFALIPTGKYPVHREEDLEQKAARGLMDY